MEIGKPLMTTLTWILLFQFEAGVKSGLSMVPYSYPPFVGWVDCLVGPVAGAPGWTAEEWTT